MSMAISGIQNAIQAGGRQVARQAAANIGTSAAVNTAVGGTAAAGSYLLPQFISTTAPATQAIFEKLALSIPSWVPFIGTKTFSVLDTMVGGGIATAAIAGNNLVALGTGKGIIGLTTSAVKSGYQLASQGFKATAGYVGNFFSKKAPQVAAPFLKVA